jgi:hypothetical protein
MAGMSAEGHRQTARPGCRDTVCYVEPFFPGTRTIRPSLIFRALKISDFVKRFQLRPK